MENLNNYLSQIVQVKKSTNKCRVHQVNLIICPAKDCTGCHYSSICNKPEFCGKCVDGLKSTIIAKNQQIINHELNPVLKEIEKTKGLIEKLRNSKDDNGLTGYEMKNKIKTMQDRLNDLTGDSDFIKGKLR